MDNIQATPRNEILGKLADILTQGKSAANQYQVLPQVPLLGGTGLGDLFMGKAPELFDDMSYDGLRGAIRGGNTATGGIGTYGARPAVADAALLGMDVSGIGAGLKGLSKRSASALVDHLSSGNVSLSRREALKKLSGIAGGAALTGTGLGAARKLLDNTVVDVAPKVMDNVAANAAKSQFRFNSLDDYLKYVIDFVDNAGEENVGSVSSVLRRRDKMYKDAKSTTSPNSIEGDAWYVDKSILDEFSPQAKAEMKEFKQKSALLDTIYGSKGSNPKEAWLKNINSDFNLDDFRKYYDTYSDGPY